MIELFKQAYGYCKQAMWCSAIASPLIPFLDDFEEGLKVMAIYLVGVGILTSLDVLSGVVKSYPNITSKEFRKTKPIQWYLFGSTFIAFLTIDILLGKDIPFLQNHYGVKMLCIFHMFNELFSLLENAAQMGSEPARFMIRLLRIKLPEEISKSMDQGPEKNDEK